MMYRIPDCLQKSEDICRKCDGARREEKLRKNAFKKHVYQKIAEKILQGYDSEEKKQICDYTWSFCKKTHYFDYLKWEKVNVALVMSAVASISNKEREDVCKRVADLGLCREKDMIKTLKTVSSIKRPERGPLIEMSHQLGGSFKRNRRIQILQKIDPKERRNIVDQTKYLCKRSCYSLMTDSEKVIEILGGYDSEERSRLVELVNSIKYDRDFIGLHELISKVVSIQDEVERKEIVDQVNRIIPEVSWPSYFIESIDILLKTERCERNAIVSIVCDLQQPYYGANARNQILKAVVSVKGNKNRRDCAAAAKFLPSQCSGCQLSSIFCKLATIDNKEKEEIVALVCRYFINDEPTKGISDFLCALHECVDKNDRESIVDLAISLREKEIDTWEVLKIIKLIATKIECHGQLIIQLSKGFITKQMNHSMIDKVLEAAAKFPEGFRKKILKVAQPYLFDFGHAYSLLFQLVNDALQSHVLKEADYYDVLCKISFSALKYSADQNYSTFAGILILATASNGLIEWDDPIVSATLNILLQIKNPSDPRNPFKIMLQYIEDANSQNPQPSNQPSFKDFFIHPESLTKVKKIPTRKDLPDGIKPEDLKQLYKICNSKGKFRSVNGWHLYYWKSEFDELLFTRLFNQWDQDKMTITAYQLAWLIDWFKQLCPEKLDSEFLKFLRCFKHQHYKLPVRIWPPSLPEAISTAFYALPLNCRGPLYHSSSALETTSHILETVLYNYLFSKSSYLNEMIGNKPSIEDPVFDYISILLKRLNREETAIEPFDIQSIYIKNRIGSSLGLPLSPILDIRPANISEELIDQSFEHLYQRFFTHFTPEVLIANFRKVADREIAACPQLYQSLCKLMGEEKTTETINLTESAAMVILIKADILTKKN